MKAPPSCPDEGATAFNTLVPWNAPAVPGHVSRGTAPHHALAPPRVNRHLHTAWARPRVQLSDATRRSEHRCFTWNADPGVAPVHRPTVPTK